VTSILLGAAKLGQIEDNRGAVRIKLSVEELAELDAATALTPVYPNWFIDQLIDHELDKALSRA
jgi:hypothetical protein